MSVSKNRLTRPRLFLLAFLAAMGSLATHMLVPALPAIADDLRIDAPAAQLVVAIYLVGLGLGQLVAGPLTDMLGRRSVLLAGISCFCVMSIACAFSNSIALLVTARLFQAFGAAAAIVSTRAIISDLSSGTEAAGRIATLTTIVLMSPMIAPSLGGMISGWANWRWIFAVLAAGGIISVIAAARRLPRDTAEPMSFTFGSLIESYRRIITNRRFRRFTLSNAFASCGLYIFLVSSPFLLIRVWGLDAEVAGFCYLLVSGAGVVGTLFVKRLESRGGALRLGLAVMTAGGATMTALAWAGWSGPAYLIAPMGLVCFGGGIAAPAGITGAMRAEPGVAGTASSLAGAFQMLLTATVAILIGALGSQSFLALAASVFVANGFAFLVAPKGRSVIDTPLL